MERKLEEEDLVKSVNQDLQHLNQLGSPTIFARAGIKNENFKNYKYRMG